MIVHEIVKHREPPPHKPAVEYYPTIYSGVDKEMSKLEYAMYVQSLPFRPGDLLVAKTAHPPYNYQDVYKLQSIDEIHRFVKFCMPAVGPLCLELEYFSGQARGSRGGGNCYKKVEQWDIPREWKERDIVDV